MSGEAGEGWVGAGAGGGEHQDRRAGAAVGWVGQDQGKAKAGGALLWWTDKAAEAWAPRSSHDLLCTGDLAVPCLPVSPPLQQQ